jgi:hypothetical protein
MSQCPGSHLAKIRKAAIKLIPLDSVHEVSTEDFDLLPVALD